MTVPVLRIQDLTVVLRSQDWLGRDRPEVRPVEGVDLELAAGQTVGLVGESGCGKSTLARSIVGLLPMAAGAIQLAGQEWQRVRGRSRRELRRQIQLVFQDPSGSLNPRLTVGAALGEAVGAGRRITRKERRQRVAALLGEVGLTAEVGPRYPHELSGGQRQRVAIARALAVDPLVLVADEPTSALDVPVQARILALLAQIQRERGMAILLISHDLHLVRKICQRLLVMYLGRIVESMSVEEGHSPRHPYSEQLAAVTPSLATGLRGQPPLVIQGDVPSLLQPPRGCPFAPRCPRRKSSCLMELPSLREAGSGHWVRCPVVLDGPA